MCYLYLLYNNHEKRRTISDTNKAASCSSKRLSIDWLTCSRWWKQLMSLVTSAENGRVLADARSSKDLLSSAYIQQWQCTQHYIHRSEILPVHTHTLTKDGHKIGGKNSPSFPGFSTATNLLFHRLSQQKENVIMTYIKGHSTSTPAI